MPDLPHHATPTTLGELIRAKREGQGLSYGQLAELVGTTKSTVHDWENDRMAPKAKSLATLARALDLTTDELSAVGADIVHEALSLPAMLRAEYDLPPEAVEQVQRYVERMARKHATTKRSSSSKQERRDS